MYALPSIPRITHTTQVPCRCWRCGNRMMNNNGFVVHHIKFTQHNDGQPTQRRVTNTTTGQRRHQTMMPQQQHGNGTTTTAPRRPALPNPPSPTNKNEPLVPTTQGRRQALTIPTTRTTTGDERPSPASPIQVTRAAAPTPSRTNTPTHSNRPYSP